MRFSRSELKAGACAFAVTVAVASAPAFADAASQGGLSPSPGSTSASSESPLTPCSPESGGMANSTDGCAPAEKSRLIEGEAVAPPEAPAAVKAVIAAADAIRTTPYIWGGGHLRWLSRGYDCSGAVGFALHGRLPQLAARFWADDALGPPREGALDHRLRKPCPRFCGNRRAALGHRRRPPRSHRPALASLHGRRHYGRLCRPPSGRLLS